MFVPDLFLSCFRKDSLVTYGACYHALGLEFLVLQFAVKIPLKVADYIQRFW